MPLIIKRPTRIAANQRVTAKKVLQYSPSFLFTQSEQGVWYDPSDMTTLFQNAAGTTPVTAVEQPVGLVLDKSGRGNHASQSTTARRPVLSARYNLLSQTEEFEDTSVWASPVSINIINNDAIAPNGTLTADKIIEQVSTNRHILSNFGGSSSNFTVVSGGTYALSAAFKAADRNFGHLNLSTFTLRFGAVFDLINGSVGATNNSGSPGGTSASITSLGSGWYRCTITMTTDSTSLYSNFGPSNSLSPPSWSLASPFYLGDGSSGIYIWGADLRVANEGSTLPSYQRVGNPTAGSSTAAGTADYDTNGFPPYLRFDGTDDFLVTGTINPGSVDKAQVFAGVRKLSDSALGEIIGLTADPGTTSGAVALAASSATGDASRRTYGASLLGTTGGASNVAIASVGLVASPNTNIVTALLDTAASGTDNQVAMRLNGVAGNYANNGQTASTGNLANAPLYIGARGGSSFPFNGHLYSLIVRFSSTNLDDVRLLNTEKWVSGKTGIPYTVDIEKSISKFAYDRLGDIIYDRFDSMIERRT